MFRRLALTLGFLLAAAPIAAAQEATPQSPAAQTAPPQQLAVELNKLEPVDGACRAYFIIRNETESPLDGLELDTFLFGSDEIILQRLALPFGPVDAGRMQIFPFDLALGCGDIGKLFVNEVLRCDGIEGCADALAMTSRADAGLDH
ncbi:hypothetical protein RDV64_06735 [Acuticoccus sp. MNP-M23]|uniref:hypothetical protein n=1 Tax=Acuticoccus sp. MNP-M23 TaxID=3072793 RepID=UPI002814E679|nr:hypothetical protein [Acuticoccus sp. MNP-M23]WMS44081.1 hypothetical protein RDV64_06735 [Acuticoccus sp. MNP-M23]